jgi:Tripartite tricarboxylate transporter family receptor
VTQVAATAALAAIALATAGSAALARDPLFNQCRAIRMIVPYTAGGGGDLGARLLAPAMGDDLGLPVHVENLPGAGSQAGITAMVRSKADGCTVGWTHLPATNAIYLDPSREAVFSRKTLTPVAMYVIDPGGIAVKADSPMNSLADLIAVAKTKPGRVSVSDSGVLSDGRLLLLELERQAAVKFAIVHSAGGAAGTADLLGGHVLCGRASDTAIFAALPLMRGMSPGPVWHAAKILECGAAAVEMRPSPDSMFAWVRNDGFVVRPPNEALKCTPISVAAHALYENGNPFRLLEPSGALDLRDAKYEQLDKGAVSVTGSRFEHADMYTIKLEGAELVGCQTVTIGGIADPTILADLDNFLIATRARTRDRVLRTYKDLPDDDWRVDYRVYGQGRTVQKGDNKPVMAEDADVGVVVEVTAKSQDLANGICAIARHQLLHQPVPR